MTTHLPVHWPEGGKQHASLLQHPQLLALLAAVAAALACKYLHHAYPLHYRNGSCECGAFTVRAEFLQKTPQHSEMVTRAAQAGKLMWLLAQMFHLSGELCRSEQWPRFLSDPAESANANVHGL